MYKKGQSQFRHEQVQDSGLRETAFSVLTPEALHRLGWLFANVHLTQRKGTGWQATLYVNDVEAPDGSHPYKDQLYEFLAYMGMRNQVTFSEPNHMVIRSTPLARLIIDACRIDPAKSLIAPEVCARETEFWSGFIEQNGNPGHNMNYHYLDIQGSRPMLEQLCHTARDIGCNSAKISGILTGKQTSEVSFMDEAADVLVHAIYPDIPELRNTLFWKRVCECFNVETRELLLPM